MTINTPAVALEKARAQSKNGPEFGVGLCLKQCRLLYGIAAAYPSAAVAWANAKYRHDPSERAPEGALHFWTGGSKGHGHVAIEAGGGICWSTDIKRPGYFDLVAVAAIEQRWGMKYVGWTEDVNNVRFINVPRNTRWARVRKNLLLVLNSNDAKNIEPNRTVIRGFLAGVRKALAKLPID